MPSLRLPHPDLSSATRTARASLTGPDAFRVSVLFLLVIALVGSVLVAVPQVASAEDLVVEQEEAADDVHHDVGVAGGGVTDGVVLAEEPIALEDFLLGDEGSADDDRLSPALVAADSRAVSVASGISQWPTGHQYASNIPSPESQLTVFLPTERDFDTPWPQLTTRVGDPINPGREIAVGQSLTINRSPNSASARVTNALYAKPFEGESAPTNMSDFHWARLDNGFFFQTPSVSGLGLQQSLGTNFSLRQLRDAGLFSQGWDHRGNEFYLMNLHVLPSAAGGAVNAADRTNGRIFNIWFYQLNDPATSPPSVTAHPSDVTVTEGEAARFSGSATAATAHQWQMSSDNGSTWQDVAGATGTSLTVNATTLAMNNQLYRVLFRNAGGEVESRAARLTVLADGPPPVITGHPSDVTVTEGEEGRFDGSASDAISQQWQVSTDDGLTWQDVAGATSTSLSVGPATSAMDGHLYRVVFTNASGSVESSSARLTVLPHDVPAILEHPRDVGVGAPRGAVFSASAESRTEMTVQWQVAVDQAAAGREEWVDLDGATSESYEIAATTLEMTGSLYRAVFTNAAGSVATDAATLTVWVAPGARLSVAPRAVHVESLRAPA